MRVSSRIDSFEILGLMSKPGTAPIGAQRALSSVRSQMFIELCQYKLSQAPLGAECLFSQSGSMHSLAPHGQTRSHPKSRNKFEDVLLFERDIEFSEQRQIPPFERTALVVLFLILNVANDAVAL